MGLITKVLKSYYRKKGFEIVLKKYKLIKGNFPQELVFPRATYAPWKEDKEYLKAKAEIEGYTLVDNYRCYELWQLARETAHLEGDILEVGVWRGGTGALMARQDLLNNLNSTIYLCDTFTGVVKTGENDNRYKGGEHDDTSMNTVKKLCDDMSLNNVKILKGIFPDDTSDQVNSEKFRLCHIDVDVYQSSKEVTDWVWDKLPIGGVVVYDDYGFSGTEGVTKLVNEHRNKSDRMVIHNLNGHGIIIKTH